MVGAPDDGGGGVGGEVRHVEDGSVGARSVIRVSPDLSELAPVRHALVHRAAEWEAPVDRAVLALLISEVLANAIEHGDPPIDVVVSWSVGRLRVEVSDASSDVPVRRRPSLHDGSGRGIWLVDRNASAWGVEARTGGKTVWFELEGA